MQRIQTADRNTKANNPYAYERMPSFSHEKETSSKNYTEMHSFSQNSNQIPNFYNILCGKAILLQSW